MAVIPSPVRDPGGAPRRPGTVTRRTLVAGAAGLAVLATPGCSGPSTSGGSPAAQPSATPALSADVAVATQALAEIRAVRTAVSGTLERYPATRVRLAAWERLHEAHEDSLVDAVPDRALPQASAAPYVVPKDRTVALSVLTDREERLQARLDALALRARSGEFARLLASMGAAIGQRLAVAAT